MDTALNKYIRHSGHPRGCPVSSRGGVDATAATVVAANATLNNRQFARAVKRCAGPLVGAGRQLPRRGRSPQFIENCFVSDGRR